VLAARIDRLAAGLKSVLQSAAVIGRTFDEAVLARVVGQAVETLATSLSALCAAELLQEAQQYPVAEYRFWHALTQEVAYGTLLSDRRTRLHAAVAEALIELDADHLDEGAAVIAWHWERARRRFEAAQWNLRAGEFALRSDIGEALRRWRVALELLEHAEESRESLELGVGATFRLIRYSARAGIEPEEADRLETRGMALAERTGNAGLSCMMVWATGSRRFIAGDLVEARARFLEAERRSEGIEDPDLKVAVRCGAFLPSPYLGPLADGLDRADRLIELCAGNAELGVAIMGYSGLAQGLNFRARLLAPAGRLGDARADLERALALARARGDREALCFSLSYPPILGWLAGDGVDASPSAVEATHLAEGTGNVFGLVASLEGLAVAHLSAGRTREAATVCERALTLGRQHRSGLSWETSLLAWLALARLMEGDPAAAAAADEAVTVARARGARVDACFALLVQGKVGAASGERDGALADLDAALTVVGEVGALTYEPFIREELGRLHGDEGELQEAARLYMAIGATGHARRLTGELTGSPASSRTAGPQ
jgi:tetratricopeptide (TPR) repeat protein